MLLARFGGGRLSLALIRASSRSHDTRLHRPRPRFHLCIRTRHAPWIHSYFETIASPNHFVDLSLQTVDMRPELRKSVRLFCSHYVKMWFHVKRKAAYFKGGTK